MSTITKFIFIAALLLSIVVPTAAFLIGETWTLQNHTWHQLLPLLWNHGSCRYHDLHRRRFCSTGS